MRTTFFFITERTGTIGLLYHAACRPDKPWCYHAGVVDDEDDDFELRRRAGPLEGFFQEAVRRAAQLGLSTFFTTEEAVRRAFSESVPSDWLDYLNQQGTDLRGELLDRMSREFGEWLRQVDMAQIMSKLLEEHDFELRISVSAQRRGKERTPELSLLQRRK
jgi:hypothetical protein